MRKRSFQNVVSVERLKKNWRIGDRPQLSRDQHYLLTKTNPLAPNETPLEVESNRMLADRTSKSTSVYESTAKDVRI